MDCTVCEGCGDGHDESNLILCDECDISYHIYCLEPPLERIPHGPWRCKWYIYQILSWVFRKFSIVTWFADKISYQQQLFRCSACRRCGNQISNIADNQRFCETCFTLRRCPKCLRFYEIGDNIIKCQHCARYANSNLVLQTAFIKNLNFH